ncbi:MAG: phosphohydrolase [bacterium]|nr:phosphohydrolase [bacterium]
MRWPDTALVRAADEACRTSVSPVTVGHSWRTAAFGLALAQVDGLRIDVEHLLAASLLHDVTLERPTPGRCFAVVGALHALEVAQRAGADEAAARAIADAVCIHVTPGIDPSRHPLGAMVSAGAALDLLGMRLCELAPAFVAAVGTRHPRLRASRALATLWRAEGRAVPAGRAAFLDRVALFSLVMRMAPFGD